MMILLLSYFFFCYANAQDGEAWQDDGICGIFYTPYFSKRARQENKVPLIVDDQPSLKRARTEMQEEGQTLLPLLDLPPELTHHILSYIDPLGLVKISHTCSLFHEIIKELYKGETIRLPHAFVKRMENRHFEQLSKQTTLLSFNFFLHLLSKEKVSYLSFGNLKKLDLGCTHIKDEGAAILAQSTSLRSLVLGSIDLTDEGAITLFKNPYFEELSLACNKLTDNSVIQFAEINETLLSLDFTKNKLTYKGAQSLAQSTSLKKLNLYAN